MAEGTNEDGEMSTVARKRALHEVNVSGYLRSRLATRWVWGELASS